MKKEAKNLITYKENGFAMIKDGHAIAFKSLFTYLENMNKPLYVIRTHKGLHNVNLEVRACVGKNTSVLNIQILKEAILGEIDMNHILLIQLSEVIEDNKLRIWMPKPDEINWSKPYLQMNIEFNNRVNAIAFIKVLQSIESTFIYRVK